MEKSRLQPHTHLNFAICMFPCGNARNMCVCMCADVLTVVQ